MHLRGDGRRRTDAVRAAARYVRRRNRDDVENAVQVVRAAVDRHCQKILKFVKWKFKCCFYLGRRRRDRRETRELFVLADLQDARRAGQISHGIETEYLIASKPHFCNILNFQ